jgi:single-stranded-DNA-specific exonuclease
MPIRADATVVPGARGVPRTARRWVLREAPDPAQVSVLAQQSGEPEIVARLLCMRGLGEPSAARTWLHGGLAELPDPRPMIDMDRAVDRLVRALRAGERIAVHGDYDVDGCTSIAVLVPFLRGLGADVTWFAPHRERDGYGVRPETVRRLASEGARVMITCDTGVSAHEAIEAGNALGLDTLVCDHHTLPAALPPAAAVLNPKRDGDASPFADLAAVGVSFMLAVALRARLRAEGFFDGVLRKEPDLRESLDIVALGTVADLAPLRGVNRLLVTAGLRVMARRQRPGLRALMDVGGLRPDETPDAGHLGFRLGPRINAAGRLDEPGKAVDCLLAADEATARALAHELDSFNARRQDVEARILAEALHQAEEQGLEGRRGLVLWSERWHPGVVGIVAARVVQQFSRPALVLGVRDGVATGSGRGIHGVDLVGALGTCSDLLLRWGGHRAAVGLSAELPRLPALREAFAGPAFEGLDDSLWEPTLLLDAELPLRQVSGALFSALRGLEPFGVGNAEPLFLARGLRASGVRPLNKGGLRMTLRDGAGASLDAVGFGLGLSPEEAAGGPVDVAFHVQENTWGGQRKIEARLRDLRAAQDPSPLS